MLINKMDTVKNPETKMTHHNLYKNLFKGYSKSSSLGISAKTQKNLKQIPTLLIPQLPEGPQYYDDEMVTDQRLREITAEIIREKILLNTRDEIPHSVAIAIDKFDESDPKITRIESCIYVDQDSQKGMIIGKGGQMLKKVGSEARKDIEIQMGNQVFLKLNVKLKKNWRKNPDFLKTLGLAPPSSKD